MSTNKSTTLYLGVGYDQHVDDTYGIYSTLEGAKQFCRDFMNSDGYDRYGLWTEQPWYIGFANIPEPDHHYWLAFPNLDGGPGARISVVSLDELLED